MIKYLLLCFIVSACLFPEGEGCFLSYRVHVHIFSSLPPNSELRVHCQSNEDDLGNHTLIRNQDYQFSFCVVPLSTLFFCHLQWLEKGKTFDAFSAKWDLNHPCNVGHCKWEAKSDGIYLAGIKTFNWQLG